MKHITLLCLVLLASVWFFGCSGAKTPTETQVAILVPVSETDKSITKNGVTVDVQSIDYSNIGMHPDLSAKFPIYTQGFLEKEPSPKEFSEGNILAGFSVPPAVTFMLKITNNSGHIIKLNGSDVGITIIGKDWRKLDVNKINMGWLNFFRANYPYQQTVPAELSSAIQNIALWDENQKILPGKTITLYAPFDVLVNKGFGTATLSIYDLVTNTDQAGNPTERTNMDFNFKESSITVKQ